MPLMALAVYVALLFASTGRLFLLLMLAPLFLDCIGSVAVRESFHATLSAKAHDARAKGHRVWGWTAEFIDTLFFRQPDHCRVQWERERLHGSVWAAWLSDWRGARS